MSESIDYRRLDGDLSVTAALVALGWVRSDDLPYVAADALAQGVDSPTLQELAGTSRADATEVGTELFARAIAELGVAPVSACKARLALVRQIAADMLDGTITERAGTRRIYWALGDWDDDECAETKARWLELDDEFDELMYAIPADRSALAKLEESVRNEAEALIRSS